MSMELVNQKVKHISLGIGTIVEQSGIYFTVEFPLKTSTFIFPDAFMQFIKAEDSSLQSRIIKQIEAVKAADEKIKSDEEAARKAAEERKASLEAARRAVVNPTAHRPAQITRPLRKSSKPMVFFVFQGNTFDKESYGGYIWAPITNKAGSNVHHWNRLLDVRVGDIILHGCDGYIAAISTACSECYKCQQPDELRVEDLWDRDGRRVDCDYIVIQRQIKTSNYKNDIISLSTAQYSPFDRNGNGNMGYLYEINRELARIFVRESVKANKYLLDYEVINNILDE